ncbi:unnamed protein product [Arabidopsis lyrata]|uniref:Predicted protein n=1 Tax=Arabidopsis lyrata subsp. lyrata TaxID=81972 RepID=D7MS32_ARALL|nr:predicted protein [Arabidopsis lyrata subsp. lyrata]CAH8278667.1 unnamed protein product [Arabidopsis lyrata]
MPFPQFPRPDFPTNPTPGFPQFPGQGFPNHPTPFPDPTPGSPQFPGQGFPKLHSPFFPQPLFPYDPPAASGSPSENFKLVPSPFALPCVPATSTSNL